ncbi:MAG: TIGR00282 family metallophosphoesterase [Planctomycetes bacterium]|nr:TIGR00282 family metallophosphoesterase [Planctomycetota bacterium]
MQIKVLCIGDIVGRPGRRILAEKLAGIVKENEIDCVIANAENAAGGSGLTPQIYEKLLKYGVNLITLGDHTYRKREILSVLENANNIVRPANMSDFSAGKGFALYETGKGVTVGVLSLIGRVFMKPSDCPFAAADRMLSRYGKSADVIFVDMHAEATSEKIAMGWYLDGKVACVLGTHTHVVTADERVLEKGTAYITDIGMTGSHKSVLGRNKENVLKSFRTQMPFPFEIATDDVQINGVIVRAESSGGMAAGIERIRVFSECREDTKYDGDDGRNESNNGFF